MIEINYTLHRDNGETRYEERQSEQVPRVGEMATFGPDHSYQVIDVLWHLAGEDGHVTVTAYELDWHKHTDKVLKAWRRNNTTE